MGNNYRIEGLTIAITNMDEMVKFYSGLFAINFEKQEIYGSTLYSGNWGTLKLLFCPAEIAGIEVTRNRQQFDIVVEDLNKFMEAAVSLGGRRLGEMQEGPEFNSAAVFDPDGNSIVFKEMH